MKILKFIASINIIILLIWIPFKIGTHDFTESTENIKKQYEIKQEKLNEKQNAEQIEKYKKEALEKQLKEQKEQIEKQKAFENQPDLFQKNYVEENWGNEYKIKSSDYDNLYKEDFPEKIDIYDVQRINNWLNHIGTNVHGSPHLIIQYEFYNFRKINIKLDKILKQNEKIIQQNEEILKKLNTTN